MAHWLESSYLLTTNAITTTATKLTKPRFTWSQSVLTKFNLVFIPSPANPRKSIADRLFAAHLSRFIRVGVSPVIE